MTNKTNEGIFLDEEQLHKLLCYLETTVIDEDAVPKKEDRIKLYDFREDLSWLIADNFNYNLEEGSIDATNYEFFTYNSRRCSK